MEPDDQVPDDQVIPDAPATPDPAAAPSELADTTTETTEAPTEGTTQVESVEKPLTKEEIATLIQKEKAKAEAKAERRAERAYRNILERLIPQQQQQQQAPTSDRPRPEAFADTDSYIEAIADWKFTQREKASRQQQEQQTNQALITKTEAIYRKAEEIEGFDRSEFNSLPLTPVITATITESDIAPQLMAYMASHPDEVERIAYLSPARQAAELGKMEAKLSASPPPSKPSKAPAPIVPVSGNKGGNKDWTELTPEEHAEARRKRIAQRK